MSDNRSLRIKANVGEDQVLNVNINQDIDILEVLSLKIDTEGVYKFHTSSYGCIAGRVFANGNFGIPNAKISIFIAATEEDLSDDIISYLYPYKTPRTKNHDAIRYNLLSEEQLSDCHRNVGTFPSKRLVLDDNNVFEVFDKYYKFTTRSNEAGDYMIFGVPTGTQTIHVDIDLSDIGILSQKPRDMVYKGYNISQFENANMFKKSTELDNLAQIITQNQSVFVYPFWGEESESDIAITRKDIEIQYEFQPTCVFIGSVVSDEASNGISKRCIPSERMGKMDRLTTGKGVIEMIRKTPMGDVEEVFVKGDELIDGNGVWCYQIPMNLDYVRTDEYGNTVPTDDPKKGIPTRARMRFRFSLNDDGVNNQYSHLAKVLVPNNPKTYEDLENTYMFGSKTSDDEFGTKGFRDLFWNNVYTVKSYIPRIQQGNVDRNKRFSGFKAVNINNANNPIPYNNMRVDLTFMFTLQCAIFKILLWIVNAVNWFMYRMTDMDVSEARIIKAMQSNNVSCLYIGDGYCPELEGWYFAPGCKNRVREKKLSNKTDVWTGLDNALKKISGTEDTESVETQNSDDEQMCITNNIKYFKQCVELFFARQYDVIQFDFYNDWINGMLYMPRWYGEIKPKRTYLFGLIHTAPKVNACMQGTVNYTRKLIQQCALEYTPDDNGNYVKNVSPKGCKNDTKQKCHKANGRKYVKIFRGTKGGGGIVHREKTMEDKYAYYFRPCEWLNNNNNYATKCNLFATDIVLIGSLEPSNIQGIPQTFERVPSSSYQMPDALASTNLGTEGFFFGSSGGTVCKGKAVETPVEKYSNDFSGGAMWLNGKNEGDNEHDADEYAVTETAGIDWGYWGPNQESDQNDRDSFKNDLNKLYFPGGHFLGISCFNSEVNIKSCVNLSRICEVGSMLSQRQAIIRKAANSDGYTYSYLIPTGFIAKDEINDYGFKNEFATLNHNGLKTKRNPLTNMLEYDFTVMHPTNFNGELESIMSESNSPYNQREAIYDDPTKTNRNVYAYRRTVEENSDDYYKFRMGIHSGDTITARDRYLGVTGNTVSMPVYDNSYYFYFGLRAGETAIDRLHEEFYAECPALNQYSPSIAVSVSNADICDGSDGSATIITRNVEEPILWRLIKNNSVVSDWTPFDAGATEQSLSNLNGNTTYTVEVKGENVDEILSYDFFVGVDVQGFLKEITYDYDSFSEEVHYNTSDLTSINSFGANCNQEIGGYLSFSGESISIIESNIEEVWIQEKGNDSANHRLYPEPDSGDSSYHGSIEYGSLESGTPGGLSMCYLWKGNQTYEIIFKIRCGNGELIDYVFGEFTATMPESLNLLFDESENATYKNIVKPMYDIGEIGGYDTSRISEYWFDILLDPEHSIANNAQIFYNAVVGVVGESAMDDVKLHVKKALFYQSSMSLVSNTGNISVTPAYGSPPYTLKLKGTGEALSPYNGETLVTLNGFNSVEAANNAGFDLDFGSFIVPTLNISTAGGYLHDYSVAGDKWHYMAHYRDSRGDNIPYNDAEYLSLPSIYRPFYFNAIFKSIYNGGSLINEAFSVAIANGITDEIDGKFYMDDLTVNGLRINNGAYRTEPDYRVINGSTNDLEMFYPTIVFENDYGRRNQGYSVSVTDHSGTRIEEYTSIKFLGDGYYDPNVRYYKISSSEKSIVESSRPYTIINGKSRMSSTLVGNTTLPCIFNAITESVLFCENTGSGGKKEIDPEIIAGKKVNELSSAETPYVVGIYNSSGVRDTDFRNNLESLEFAYKKDSGVTPTVMEALVKAYPRHVNSISVLRLYTMDEFKELIINDEVAYTDEPGGDSGGGDGITTKIVKISVTFRPKIEYNLPGRWADSANTVPEHGFFITYDLSMNWPVDLPNGWDVNVIYTSEIYNPYGGDPEINPERPSGEITLNFTPPAEFPTRTDVHPRTFNEAENNFGHERAIYMAVPRGYTGMFYIQSVDYEETKSAGIQIIDGEEVELIYELNVIYEQNYFTGYGY